jgi:mono/diheme cytochrome c family protein
MRFAKSVFPGILLVLLAAVTTSTCTREYVEDLRGVCFERDVLPVFQSNCTQSGCHNGEDRAAGYDLSSYDNILNRGVEPGNYRGSAIYEVLVLPGGEELMPRAPYSRLTDDQITSIALWIEEGAQNTTCHDSTFCNTADVRFGATIQPLLQTYCYGCHGGSSPQGGVDFNTYTGVKATATNGSLLGSIEHTSGFSPMPQNGNKLSTCNINIIKAWIDAGAPDN